MSADDDGDMAFNFDDSSDYYSKLKSQLKPVSKGKKDGSKTTAIKSSASVSKAKSDKNSSGKPDKRGILQKLTDISKDARSKDRSNGKADLKAKRESSNSSSNNSNKEGGGSGRSDDDGKRKSDARGDKSSRNINDIKDKAFGKSPSSDKPKAPRVVHTLESDPNQYHARPADLSKDAVPIAKAASNHRSSNYIFSRTPFNDLGVTERLAKHLEAPKAEGGLELKFSTRVQSVVLPLLVKNRYNLLMKSQTGSGKTLAYLIPIVNDLITAPFSMHRSDGTRAVIIGPTRELCSQINDVVTAVTQCYVSIVGGCLSGGEKKKSEKTRLRKGVVILVSTPGRLLDHLQHTEAFNLKHLRWVVFDEADRLLDLGFEQTIREILDIMRGDKDQYEFMSASYKAIKEAKASGTYKPLPAFNPKRVGKLSDSGDKDMHSDNDNDDDDDDDEEEGENEEGENDNHENDDNDDDDDDGDNKGAVRSSNKSVKDASRIPKSSPHYAKLNKDKDKDKDEDAHLKHTGKRYFAAKVSSKSQEIRLIFASATLSRGVRTLAAPMIGDKELFVVDADREIVENLDSALKLETLWEKEKDKEDPSKATGADTDGDSGVKRSFSELNTGDETLGKFTEDDKLDVDLSNKRHRGVFDKDEAIEAPEQLQQYYMLVTCKWKLAALLSFLKTHSDKKLVVFFSTCDAVDYHTLLFREAKWPLEMDKALDWEKDKMGGGFNFSKERSYLEPLAIRQQGILGPDCDIYRLHGSMPQITRHQVFKEFSKAKTGVLLCTDVAARGLDLPKIDWIIQYDPPCETSDYVHRVGRTARKGLGGSSLILLLPSEAGYITLLQSHKLVPRPLSLQSLLLEASKSIPGSLKFKNLDEMVAVILQRRIETVVSENKHLTNGGIQAFHSFVRSYATHSIDTKAIFKVQALHLGHLAKAFGLRDNPKTLEVGSDNRNFDILNKINIGDCSRGKEYESKTMTKEERNKKYALSNQVKTSRMNLSRGNKFNSGGGSGSRGRQNAPSGNFRQTDGYFKKRSTKVANSKMSSNGINSEFSA